MISAGYIRPNIQPFSTGLILSNTQPIPSSISSFSQPFIIPSSKPPILTNTNVLTRDSSQVWNSESSPYPYEIVVLPKNVFVYYGNHSKFLVLKRAFLSNLVIEQGSSHHRKKPSRGVISSIVDEGIKTILNLFTFFLQEDFTRTKSTKTTKSIKSLKTKKA